MALTRTAGKQAVGRPAVDSSARGKVRIGLKRLVPVSERPKPIKKVISRAVSTSKLTSQASTCELTVSPTGDSVEPMRTEEEDNAQKKQVISQPSEPDHTGTGEEWTHVVNKNTARRVAQAEKSLEAFRQRLTHSASGVFCVSLYRRIENNINGVTVFEEAPFTEGILPLCSEICKVFPFAKPISRNGRIQIWTNTVEDAREVLKTTCLLGIPVITKCNQLNHNWARITGVDRGYSVVDILAALSWCGVLEVKRESSRRKVGENLVSFDTDRILLKFTGVPPPEVTLAGRTYRVTLHAGSPLSCYRCQKLGHISANCKNEIACKKCGSSSHLVAECRNRPRCVNCKGPHTSSSAQCPLRAIAMEKRKSLMETRLVQQLKSAHPSAEIGTISEPAHTPEVFASDQAESTGLPPKSYAAVVRSMVVEADSNSVIRVNLPGPTPIPKKKKDKLGKSTVNLKKRVFSITATSKSTSKKASSKDSPLKLIKPIVQMLEAVCPDAVAYLRKFMASLGPLLSMLQGMSGRFSDH